MLMDEIPAKAASESRVSLAIMTEPGQANAFGIELIDFANKVIEGIYVDATNSGAARVDV